MPKPSPVTWSETHFHNKLGFERLHSAERSVAQRVGPPGASPVKPAADSAFKPRGQRFFVFLRECRCEADAIEAHSSL